MQKIGPNARNLPVVGALLGVVAIAALGLAYWSSVTSRERYLQSRNFRLLADITEQAQTIVSDTERLVRGAIASDKCEKTDRPTGGLSKETSRKWADFQKCGLRQKGLPRSDGKRGVKVLTQRSAPAEVWRGDITIDQSTASVEEVVQDLNRYRNRILGVASDVRFEWSDPDQHLPRIEYQVPSAALFSVALDAKRWDRAFSTMAITTPDGRILFAVGPQAAEVMANSMAALLSAASGKTGDTSSLVAFATGVSSGRVRLAGVDYWVYAQPCCRTESVSLPLTSSTPGLVVIGLADADALRSLSLAISPLLVLTGAAFVLACLVGWTFLKCSLMGPLQRLGRHDVVNLLTSGIFGVSLTTILLLTVSSYARLNADMDARLDRLSADVEHKFKDELAAAARQLEGMVAEVQNNQCQEMDPSQSPSPGKFPTDPCQSFVNRWSSGPPDFGYPTFINFSMINPSGLQAVKAARSGGSQTVLDVSQRAYYQHSQTREGLWSLGNRCPDGCYLEYVSSWNTGRPQVVIALPTSIERLPVATLSIPMHSLLAPILPADFDFAIVDPSGLVQFHSDPQRNGLENLLLETDQNPRLRSLISAHGAGTFDTTYWGYPYHGYVRPAPLAGWSVVALQEKQTTRAVVLEWFIIALLLTSLYTLACVVVMLFLLRRGTSWLWPDPLRRHWYLPLGCLAIAGAVTWVLIAWSQPVDVAALAGVLIPAGAWFIAYAALGVRPPGVGEVKQWTELRHEYQFAGTMLLLLTAAVPAAAFYALSYDHHIEAFVKERQIALARRIDSVTPCGPAQALQRDDARYDDAAHDGEITCVQKNPNEPESKNDESVHTAFEQAVPYFTSASIALRELMHEKSDDDTWSSRVSGNRVLQSSVLSVNPNYLIQVARSLPSTVDWRGSVAGADVVLTSVVSLSLLVFVAAAAYLVIAFLLRRVLLADVVEPIRRCHRIVTQVGQHLQVICRDPSWMAERVTDLYLLRITPVVKNDSETTVADICGAVSASQRIAIPDLEEASDDAGLFDRKLEIVETIMNQPNQTVMLFTCYTAPQLADVRRKVSEESADRWLNLAGRLRVTELPARTTTTSRERWKQHLRTLMHGWRDEFISRWQDWRAPLRWRARLLELEGQSDPKIDEIVTDLQKSPAFVSGSLTRDQILEEIEERADQHYRGLWEARSEQERAILEHVARNGLASAASRRIVRQLLAAGLLRKDPELRLMGESFRRFVLEPERRQEVAAFEEQSGASLWDRLRVPLALSGTLSLLFLVVTQREALDTTVSMALGVTTAVPTLVKLTTLLAQLSSGASGSKGNA